VADEKTRVLSSAEAARLFSRKPKVVGDKVVFYCDNGHRVVTPRDQAGKRGTCSKCGTPLVVPPGEAEAEAADVTTILAVPRQPAAQDVPATGSAATGSAATGSGGLNGAAAVTFSASADETTEAAAEPSPESEEPGPVGAAAAAEAGGFGVLAETGADEPLPPGEAEGGQAWPFMDDAGGTAVDGEAADAEGFDNPTARLVARLWVEHQLGGTLELHLQDGSVILPQSYEPRWSRGTHGLFAAAAPDNSITLTAVAWESVQKIIVRNVKGLPDGMFE
jgi:hypothetical protein